MNLKRTSKILLEKHSGAAQTFLQNPRTIGVIPARYASTRLPGKPLADICGKPMLLRVYERVSKLRALQEIYVATDDQKIAQMCSKHSIPYIMTQSSHPTAAHRLQEVSRHISGDFYLQLNGDEPLLDVRAAAAAIPRRIPAESEFGTNIITNISDPSEVMDPSNIKVVFDSRYRALYMSRTPIPYPFHSLAFPYYKHVGIIGYNKKMLDFYAGSTPGKLEQIEGIDTLRFLDYGKRLQFIPVKNLRSLSVDTPKDLEHVRKVFEKM